MTAPEITCIDCQETRPRYAQQRCKPCYRRGRQAGAVSVRWVKRPWTAAELTILDRRYCEGVRAMAGALGRSESAIKFMARRRGLNLRTEYNLADLALALGCHRRTPARWRQEGRLQATGRGYLSEGALHRFFCTQRALWEKHPCPDRAWITALLADARLRRDHGCG